VAYTINKTDGSLYATVADGTVDSTSSLKLIGKNYTGYGEIQNENYFRLLESHAFTAPPGNPQKGQLWFDTANSVLNVYTDGTMLPKALAVQATSLTEPAAIDSQVGDTWYNTTTHQLTVYDGTSYTTVGPLYSSEDNGESGALVETIIDDVAAPHVVTMLKVEDVIVGIVSTDPTFTPDPAILDFPSDISPGITIATTAQFTGDATNALLLNNQSSADFLSSLTDNSSVGKLDIVNDTGLTVGLSNDLRIGIFGGTHAEIVNDTVGGDIYIRTEGGAFGSGITIDGATGNARVELPSNGLDIVNQSYLTSVTSSKLDIDGSLSMTGSLVLDDTAQVQAGYSGTYATPGYSFAADTNTGMMRGSADRMYLVTAGIPRLAIAADGQLSTGNTPDYETLVTTDDVIPNKKYVDDAIAGRLIGFDNPNVYGVSMQTSISGAWTTFTGLPNTATFAMVVATTYSIASSSSNGTQSIYARKKGVTGGLASRWRFAYGGGGADSSFGEFTVGSGSKIVECDANGDFEYYGYTSGGTAPSADIIIVAYWV